MLVGSDMITDKNFPAISKGKGDAFMIVGATLYGICMQPLLYRNYFTAYNIVSQPMLLRSFLLEDLRFMKYFSVTSCIATQFHFFPLLNRSLDSSACGVL
jgi:hypothetical protein